MCFQFGNRQFWASSRKSRDCEETYALYVAQEIPQIYTEIAQKGHFRMETNYIIRYFCLISSFLLSSAIVPSYSILPLLMT